jgi:hypothetical protein
LRASTAQFGGRALLRLFPPIVVYSAMYTRSSAPSVPSETLIPVVVTLESMMLFSEPAAVYARFTDVATWDGSVAVGSTPNVIHAGLERPDCCNRMETSANPGAVGTQASLLYFATPF